jgi:hypothetical protein
MCRVIQEIVSRTHPTLSAYIYALSSISSLNPRVDVFTVGKLNVGGGKDVDAEIGLDVLPMLPPKTAERGERRDDPSDDDVAERR